MYRVTAMLIGVTALPVMAQMVRYEGNVFPEDAGIGWERLDLPNQAERSIESGQFVQEPVPLPCPPDCSTQDYYRLQLVDQADAEFWVMEWTVETNTPAEFGAVAPASIVAGGFAGVSYHITIGSDLVRFNRDPAIPDVIVPISPGPHQYRVELDNSVPPGTFTFLIDGVEIDSGPAEGVFPTSESRVTWGAVSSLEMPNETRWDHIAVGTPVEAIPVVSQWGLIVLVLTMLLAGSIVFYGARGGLVCSA